MKKRPLTESNNGTNDGSGKHASRDGQLQLSDNGTPSAKNGIQFNSSPPKYQLSLSSFEIHASNNVLVPILNDDDDSSHLILLASQGAKLESLNHSLEVAGKEISSLKNQNQQFEQAIAASLGRETRIQKERSMELENVYKLYQNQIMKLNELMNTVEKERKMKFDLEKEKDGLLKELKSITEELSALKEEKKEEKKNFESTFSKMQNDFQFELRNSKEKIKLLEKEIAMRDEEIVSFQNVCENFENGVKRLSESRVEKFEIPKKNEYLDEEKKEYKIIIQNLKEELANGSKMIEDAKFILKKNKNVCLLEEELIEERKKSQFLESQIKSKSTLESDFEILKSQAKEWNQFLEKFPNAENAETVYFLFSNLQKENVLLMERNRKLEKEAFEFKNRILKLEATNCVFESDLRIDQSKKINDLECELCEQKQILLKIEKENENLRRKIVLLEKNVSNGSSDEEMKIENENENEIKNQNIKFGNLDIESLWDEKFLQFARSVLSEKYELEKDGDKKRRAYFGCFEKDKLVSKLLEMENVQIQTERNWIQKFQNLRMAVFLLLGFLVDVEANNEARNSSSNSITNPCPQIIMLRSIFSQNSNHESFCFRFGESYAAGLGFGLELERNTFGKSKEMEEMMKTFPQDASFIPAFFSNLTLANFNKNSA